MAYFGGRSSVSCIQPVNLEIAYKSVDWWQTSFILPYN